MNLEVKFHLQRKAGFVLDVTFACHAGAIGVVGPSGSGKSTLLDCIAGIERGGRVILDGIDFSDVPLHRRNIGYVAQHDLLFPHLSVRDNVQYSPHAQGTQEIAARLGIAHLLDRMPRHLSGGERRRVALARALVSRPRILLLDEPFGGLDEERRRDSLALLALVRQQYDIPMILVSHRANDVAHNTDWAICLENGTLVDAGPTGTVLADRLLS